MKQKQLLAGISAGLISLGMVGSANAALIGRLAATLGGTDYQAYYDDEANLTWLADANYAQTSGYTGTGVLATGRMNWQAANDWAAQLTVGGVSGWRLATTDPASSGYGKSNTEMGNLFYNTLGNTAQSSSLNAGPFSNLQNGSYWSATEFASTTTDAYRFIMSDGNQVASFKTSFYYGWAVQSGDVPVNAINAVSAVPVPAAVWLFGSGLLGLAGVARRKSANP